MSFLKKYTNLTAYNADLNKDFPNISYIQESDEMKWNKYDPDIVVCKYNVTSTESATQLLGSNTSGFSKQYIDGVEQQSIQNNYTFSTTGEHIVKYISSTTIGSKAFQNCTSLTSIAFPNKIKHIGEFVFSGCGNLTKVIIPDIASWCKVTYSRTYYNKPLEGRNLYRDEDTKVTNLTIPNGVTSIGANAFYGCKGLITITIPSSVTEIGDDSFTGTIDTQTITVEATTPPTITQRTFWNLRASKIYVPAESVEAYKAAQYWSTYASIIQAIPT